MINDFISTLQKKRLFHVHIPKTGGTTFNSALSDSKRFVNGEHSFCQVNFDLKGKVNVSTGNWRTHQYMGFDHCNDFRVAIVRNPYSWLVSYYNHIGYSRFKLVKHSGWQGCNDYHNFKNFDEFINAYCDDDFDWHVPPLHQNQLGQMTNSSNELEGEFLLFSERLDQSLPTIAQELELTYSPKKINASRTSSDYRTYYNDKTIELVYKKMEAFFLMTGYTFDGLSSSELGIKL